MRISFRKLHFCFDPGGQPFSGASSTTSTNSITFAASDAGELAALVFLTRLFAGAAALESTLLAAASEPAAGLRQSNSALSNRSRWTGILTVTQSARSGGEAGSRSSIHTVGTRQRSTVLRSTEVDVAPWRKVAASTITPSTFVSVGASGNTSAN